MQRSAQVRVCDGNLIIGTGGGTHRHPKYACSNDFNRCICGNDLYIRQDQLEECLLGKLQADLLRKEVVEDAPEECGTRQRASTWNLSDGTPRQFAENGIADRRGLLNRDPALAKPGPQKHLSEIKMIPTEDHLDCQYLTEGTWSLLADNPGLAQTRLPSDGRIRMVAGVGFEPTTFGL